MKYHQLLTNLKKYAFIYSIFFQDQSRTKLDCPVCEAKELRKLSNHLKMVHKIDGMERKSLILKARSGQF